jgi:hypothetical protein
MHICSKVFVRLDFRLRMVQKYTVYSKRANVLKLLILLSFFFYSILETYSGGIIRIVSC